MSEFPPDHQSGAVNQFLLPICATRQTMSKVAATQSGSKMSHSAQKLGQKQAQMVRCMSILSTTNGQNVKFKQMLYNLDIHGRFSLKPLDQHHSHEPLMHLQIVTIAS